MSATLILHHYWRSSSSWRVRWALAHKRVPYESRAVDLLKGAQSDPAYIESSPMGLVPCLVVDGRALTESVAIVEWLEETHPSPPLYPRDPWARARTRQLVELVNSGTQPLQNLGVNRYVSSELPAQAAWARHWITRGLDAIEKELGIVASEGLGGAFAIGDSLSAADLYLVPQLYNARRFSIELAAYPRIVAAEKAALATESALASHPDRFQPTT
jgi:maleylacetoacetate isomerase